MSKTLRGLRGATTAAANTSQAILDATAELLRALQEANAFQPDAQTEFTQGFACEIKQVRRRMDLSPVQSLQPREQSSKITGRQKEVSVCSQQPGRRMDNFVRVRQMLEGVLSSMAG